MTDVEANRTDLYLQFDDLFRDGTFKELYQGEKTIILNVGGQFLAAIPFTDRLEDDSFAFIAINDNEARAIKKDESIMAKIIVHRLNNGKIAPLNQKTKEVLKRINAERFDEGTDLISPELEEEISSAKNEDLNFNKESYKQYPSSKGWIKKMMDGLIMHLKK